VHVMVMAKAPVAGRVKTRLVPPYTHQEAAALATAALADTLDAALASSADEVIVALDGQPGDWLPPGCRLIAQRGVGLAQRLASAWADAGGPGVQIGMDTPQVRPADLDASLAVLVEYDAALGMADDGGWWAIALRSPDRRVFDRVPMSRPDTGRRQLDRLDQLGLRVARLPVLRDVDRAADVVEVAAVVPGGRFALAAASMGAGRA
jgi:rSAM/selenodomain-associated transferase 1